MPSLITISPGVSPQSDREGRPGDQITALVMPFGDREAEKLGDDRWSQLTGIFNHVRSATAEAAAVAIGEGPAILPGVVLGDRSKQDAELTEAMRVAGLSHIGQDSHP